MAGLRRLGKGGSLTTWMVLRAASIAKKSAETACWAHMLCTWHDAAAATTTWREQSSSGHTDDDRCGINAAGIGKTNSDRWGGWMWWRGGDELCALFLFMCCFCLRCSMFVVLLFLSLAFWEWAKLLLGEDSMDINSTGGPTSKICERTGAGDTGVCRDNRRTNVGTSVRRVRVNPWSASVIFYSRQFHTYVAVTEHDLWWFDFFQGTFNDQMTSQYQFLHNLYTKIICRLNYFEKNIWLIIK